MSDRLDDRVHFPVLPRHGDGKRSHFRSGAAEGEQR